MKIVILCGSARKGGNTDSLAHAFADGASEHNEVEIISVGEFNVKPCIGCNVCRKREKGSCFQQDDMPEIYDKLKTAEMIVIASPVYFYGLSAQLKAMIDRLHAPIRNEFKVKKLALLLVAADTIPEVFDSILVQYQAILKYFHLADAGQILVREVEAKGAIGDNPALDEARELGASIGHSGQSEKNYEMNSLQHFIRRQDREIKDMETVQRILEALPIGHLAMNDNGKPYGVTMNYFAETQDGVTTLYFHGAKTGRKAEIIAANPAVYFFAERDDGPREKTMPDGSRNMTEFYLSVAGEGKMELLDEPTEKKRILLALTNKYADKPFESFPDAVLGMTAVWKLILKNITGKSNPPMKTPEMI